MSEFIDVALFVGVIGLAYYYIEKKAKDDPLPAPIGLEPAPVSSPIPVVPAPVSSPIPVVPIPVSSPIPLKPVPVSSPIPVKPVPVSSPIPVVPVPVSSPIPVIPSPIRVNPPNPISLKKPVPPIAGSYQCPRIPQFFVVPMGMQGENVYSGYPISPYDDHATPTKIGNFSYWFRQQVDENFVKQCGTP